MKTIIASCLMVGVFCSFSTIEKTNTNLESKRAFTTTEYPAAFVIGEYSNIFETLNDQYTQQLLAVCENDLDKAYTQWKRVLADIDRFAQLNGFKLKGTKMWIKIYWSEDGQIEHIAYDLKRQSKKINKKKFTDLLEKYIASKPEPFMKSENNFSHYGSVNYPVHATSIYAD